jgi:PAS domain S-box-containing protein
VAVPEAAIRTAPAPRLVCLPSRDEAFSDYVHAIRVQEDPASPIELERRLQRVYPSARVRRRDLTGEASDLWYVFRESPYTFPVAEDWWHSPDVAHVAVTFGGVAVEANDAVLGLLGVERDGLIGQHYRGFVPPEALHDAGMLMKIVLRRRTGASRVVLKRGDGRRIEVEWHAQVRGTRLHAWFRPV